MAQSVAIPNKIVQISPTSSAPQLTSIKDNGYLWRVYPSDALQGKVLAQAAADAFGKGATLNVGARNDAGLRFSLPVDTPAANSYVYADTICPSS